MRIADDVLLKNIMFSFLVQIIVEKFIDQMAMIGFLKKRLTNKKFCHMRL